MPSVFVLSCQDFREQVIHHLATITLLSFSYCANYIRIGTLVMLLHDSSDILLEVPLTIRLVPPGACTFSWGSGSWFLTGLCFLRVLSVCQDVQLRDRLEDHQRCSLCRLCRGFPRDSPRNLPQQVGIHPRTLSFIALRRHGFRCFRRCCSPCRILHTTLVLSMESFEPFAGYYFFNAMLMVLQALHVFWAGLILRMVYKFVNGNVRLKLPMLVFTAEHHPAKIKYTPWITLAARLNRYLLLLTAGKGRAQRRGE